MLRKFTYTMFAFAIMLITVACSTQSILNVTSVTNDIMQLNNDAEIIVQIIKRKSDKFTAAEMAILRSGKEEAKVLKQRLKLFKDKVDVVDLILSQGDVYLLYEQAKNLYSRIDPVLERHADDFSVYELQLLNKQRARLKRIDKAVQAFITDPGNLTNSDGTTKDVMQFALFALRILSQTGVI